MSSDLSPLPFRPEDFIAENTFVREILEKGIKRYNMDLALGRPPRLRQCRWRAGLCITIRRKE